MPDEKYVVVTVISITRLFAAKWLGHFGKIAILDVDYHAGNGTQEIFYENDNVLTVSLHADPAQEYPYYAGFAEETGTGPGNGFHRNFTLPTGTDQTQYLKKHW